jgi:hypothetical protein
MRQGLLLRSECKVDHVRRNGRIQPVSRGCRGRGKKRQLSFPQKGQVGGRRTGFFMRRFVRLNYETHKPAFLLGLRLISQITHIGEQLEC